MDGLAERSNMEKGSNIAPYCAILLLLRVNIFSAFFQGRDKAKEVIQHDTGRIYLSLTLHKVYDFRACCQKFHHSLKVHLVFEVLQQNLPLSPLYVCYAS